MLGFFIGPVVWCFYNDDCSSLQRGTNAVANVATQTPEHLIFLARLQHGQKEDPGNSNHSNRRQSCGAPLCPRASSATLTRPQRASSSLHPQVPRPSPTIAQPPRSSCAHPPAPRASPTLAQPPRASPTTIMAPRALSAHPPAPGASPTTPQTCGTRP